MDGFQTDRISLAARESDARFRLDPYDVPPPDSTDAVRFIHRMTDDHLQIMVDIVCLEREKERAGGSGRAGAVLSRVVSDLCAVRDAAGAVVLDASDPDLAGLFQPDAPLAVYVTGLLMWTRAVVHVMRGMCASVADGRPAWQATRRRVGHVGAMHFAGLGDDCLSHVEALCAARPHAVRLVDFQRALRRLVSSADALGRSLHESFTVTPVE
jgi:hypothetical protein